MNQEKDQWLSSDVQNASNNLTSCHACKHIFAFKWDSHKSAHVRTLDYSSFFYLMVNQAYILMYTKSADM